MCKSLNRRGCGDDGGSGRLTGQDLQKSREWRAWRQADQLGQPGRDNWDVSRVEGWIRETFTEHTQ